MVRVDARFWFDPSCPYTWVTSRWMRELERLDLLRVEWRVMSLSVLNEHRDDDPEDDPEGYLWGPARLFAAVQHRYGPDAVGALYDVFGAMVHGSEDGWRPAGDILTAAGLPRMPALVFVCLYTSEAESMTASELAARLEVSLAAISSAVRFLAPAG